MSRNFLLNLNGNKNGELKKFLDAFVGEPRIAWYPSAGEDFRPILYLHPKYSTINASIMEEPNPPDIFLFTDYYPWEYSTFLDSKHIYFDHRTSIYINHIEELPSLNLPLHKDLVDFPEGSKITNKVLFLNLEIISNKLNRFSIPVIYAFAENVMFYCNKLIPNNAVITHLIHVRYGGGLGGGGTASGAWLLNVLNKLSCKVFITDNHHPWQYGDEFALNFCSSIPKKNDTKLTSIRKINSASWSDNGDISWNLIN